MLSCDIAIRWSMVGNMRCGGIPGKGNGAPPGVPEPPKRLWIWWEKGG